MRRINAARVRRTVPLAILLALGFSGTLCAKSAEASRQWAVLIAIQDYEEPEVNDLHVTLNDARALKKTLVERAGVQEDCLLEMNDLSPADFRPTKDFLTIRIAEFLKKPKKGDTLLFFFSGHGVEYNGDAYLIPIDAKPRDISTLVRAAQIGQLLNLCQAEVKFLILDSCCAGGNKALPYDRSKVAQPNPVKDAVKKAPLREPSSGRAPASARGAKVNGSDVGRVMNNVLDKQTYVVLESCKSDEFSYEWPERRQSIFTYWLCRALEGAADKDGDGRITAYEVHLYTLDRVAQTIKGLRMPGWKQTPTRELGADINGDPIVLKVSPEHPDELCRRLAGHLDEEIRLRGLKAIRVAKEFRVKTAGGPALGSFPLPGYLAQRIKHELDAMSRARQGYEVIDDAHEDEPDATVLGEVSWLETGIGIQCDLFTKNGSLVKPSGFLEPSVSVLADAGMTIGPPRPRDSRSVAVRRVADPQIARRDEALGRTSWTPPIKAGEFPYRVEILATDSGLEEPPAQVIWRSKDFVVVPRVAEKSVALLPDPRKLMFRARVGERFKIRVTNDSNERVAAIVLVDGLNTIGKKPELLGQGRGWLIDAKSHVDVEGWDDIKSTGQSAATGGKQELESEFKWFVFTDLADSVAKGRQVEDEKIGLITVAFYAEKKGTDRGAIGVGEVGSARVKREVVPFKNGPLMTVIQLGYADDPELPSESR